MKALLRVLLYIYVLLVACPVRYWPLESGVDQTWRFALNYAHALGIETVFTTGPLAYLMFPQHIGRNLPQALTFQALLWLFLAIVFGDLFFRCGFRVRNLAVFSVCYGLASPLFWTNSFGIENIILSAALLLITVARSRSSGVRYFTAVILIALLPLFKFTAGVIGAGALAGCVVDRAVREGRKFILTAGMTMVLAAGVTAGAYLWLMPSVAKVLAFLRGTMEIMSGYTGAMSLSAFVTLRPAALLSAALLAALLALMASSDPHKARFFCLMLAAPLFMSFKHGFVRDGHAVDFFCFVALALALISLGLDIEGRNVHVVFGSLVIFLAIWTITLGVEGRRASAFKALGERSIQMLWGAFDFRALEQRLDAAAAAFPDTDRLEPALLAVIGDQSVASLSMNFTNQAAAGTRLFLYPVIQRYSAYTPYLDGLNASWIRDKGPRFLVFDGLSIDLRDPWAETPAMWLEVYRWYDTRLTGTRNLLLERRSQPRFQALASIERFEMALPGEVPLPASREDVFWTLGCRYNVMGKLRNLLFRNPDVNISVREQEGPARSARVIPALLVSPVPGNFLPGSLAQFAALFQPDSARPYYVEHIIFESAGTSSYTPICNGELFRPVPAPR